MTESELETTTWEGKTVMGNSDQESLHGQKWSPSTAWKVGEESGS